MGIDVEFVRVSQKELESLLDGELELQFLKPSPSRLPKDQNGQIEPLTVLTYKYCFSDWTSVEHEATKLKVSEVELKREAKKLGLHIWFDSSRQWNELHKLLTGEYALDRLGLRTHSGNLLSTAIIAGKSLDGGDTAFGDFGESYLTAPEVKEIANQLKQLTYEELSRKNPVDTGVADDAMRDCFNGFKQFFMDAADEQEAVVRLTG